MFTVQVEHFKDGRRAVGELERQIRTRSHVEGLPPRLHPVGERFRQALEASYAAGLAAVSDRLMADAAAAAPRGLFAFFRFHPDPRLLEALGGLDPILVETRLAGAAEAAIHDRLRGAQGLTHIAYERDRAPVVFVLISALRADQKPSKILGPVDLQGLEAAWHARSHGAFGLARLLEPERPRPPKELQERWSLARRDVHQSISARMRGEIGQAELRSAIDKADAVQREWEAARGLRSRSEPEVVRAVPVVVERGAAHLRPLDERERREVLTLAVEGVSREVVSGKVSVVHSERPKSDDLHLLVRYDGGRDPDADRAALKEALARQLGPAISEEAGRYPHWAPGEELGPVRVATRQLERSGTAFEVPIRIEGVARLLESRIGPARGESRAGLLRERFGGPLERAVIETLGRLPQSSSFAPRALVTFPTGHVDIRVRLEAPGSAAPGPGSRETAEAVRTALVRDFPGVLQRGLEAQGVVVRGETLKIRVGPLGGPGAEPERNPGRAALSPPGGPRPRAHPGPPRATRVDRLQPGGDVFMVRFRVERGQAYLSGLPVPRQQEVLGRAAARAFPGLRESGFRPDVQAQRDGDALLVRVTVPASYLGDRDLTPSRATQARFSHEFYLAGGELQGRPRPEPLAIVRHAAPGPPRARVAAPEPPGTRGMPLPGPSLWDRVGRMAPVAFRTTQTILRWAGRLLPREE